MLNSQTYTIASTLAPHDRLSFYRDLLSVSRNLLEHLFNPRTVVCKSAKDVLVKMHQLYFREI